jgi:hypothetical protein
VDLNVIGDRQEGAFNRRRLRLGEAASKINGPHEIVSASSIRSDSSNNSRGFLVYPNGSR